MRMDQSTGLTAAGRPREYSEGELRRIFERYGEEKLAGRYARAIIAARDAGRSSGPGGSSRSSSRRRPYAAQRAGHPAKRVFQALRIEVNAELSVLERAIPAALDVLPVGGRIVVMSYQSLEDRLVKRAFAEAAASTAPPACRSSCPSTRPRFRLLVRGAELASDEETRAQPARDARAAARRRADQGGRMSLAAAARVAPRPAARESAAGGCAPSGRPLPGAGRRSSTRSSPWPARSRSAPRRWRSRS